MPRDMTNCQEALKFIPCLLKCAQTCDKIIRERNSWPSSLSDFSKSVKVILHR